MRNWTIKEAVDTIREGTDFAGMKEIAGFNPVFFKAVCENDVSAVAALMGEKFTLRRLSREVLEDVAEDDVVENDDVNTSANEKATAPKSEKATPVADKPLGDMTTKELIVLCDERGIKVPKYGKNKAFYLDALAGGDETDEADEGEDKAEANPYEGKSAMSLFKMCKDRGIKVEARQKSKVYIDLLMENDAAGDDAEGDDKDWADEVEEEKPAKAPVKGKPAAEGGKKAAAAVEDDEEWDI